MASLGVLGFLGGASGQALKSIESRQDEEREMRKARMLAELRKETDIYLAEYHAKLEGKNVDDKLSSFDSTTNEFIMRNKRGEELGRRNDPGMAEDYKYKREVMGLDLESKRANIDQSRASADASRASASAQRSYAARAARSLDSDGNPKFDDTQRLAAVNKIEDNLKNLGLNNAELASIRSRMLEGVREGQNLDWFVDFERFVIENMDKEGAFAKATAADAVSKIKLKPE